MQVANVRNEHHGIVIATFTYLVLDLEFKGLRPGKVVFCDKKVKVPFAKKVCYTYRACYVNGTMSRFGQMCNFVSV
jgi:hypothetical protein